MIDYEFAAKILKIVEEINGGFVERLGKGHATAFFEYSGHENSIYVTVYTDGWYSDTQEEPKRFYFENYYEEERMKEELEHLQGIKTLIKAARFRDKFKRKPVGVRNDLL